MAGPDSPFGTSPAPPLFSPSDARHYLHPHLYLDMAFSEWTIQQLVAYILGFGQQMASLRAHLGAPQRLLAALGCLHRIQTPSPGTIGVRTGSRDEAHSQGHQENSHCFHSCFKAP